MIDRRSIPKKLPPPAKKGNRRREKEERDGDKTNRCLQLLTVYKDSDVRRELIKG